MSFRLDYGGRTVADLRNLCRERGLSPTGRSGELRERLEADDRLQSAAAANQQVTAAAEAPEVIGHAREVADRRLPAAGGRRHEATEEQPLREAPHE